MALQEHDELECGCLDHRNAKWAARQRSDKTVNGLGMGCRQQRKLSLRCLERATDCRTPEVDRQMGTDLVDE
jgi:hypothetical protein